MTLAPGSRLGPYEVLSPLGAGGMGEVYRAFDPKLKREVAIKILPGSLALDADLLARFEREALAVAALSHPNILAIHDFGRHEGIPYAVMELLEGSTLREVLRAGPVPRKLAVDYALQIARGLSAAHEKGIVHRDLKPENLFVTRDGHVKILDFGLARREAGDEPEGRDGGLAGAGRTETGIVMGTFGYMSPEQLRGERVDHRSDLFAFGSILYELLSGKKAFRRVSGAETMEAILRDDPPDLSAADPEVPAALADLVRRCLAKDPDERIPSARDVTIALGEFWSPVTPLPSRGGGRRTWARKSWPAVMAVAGVLLAVAASSVWVWRVRAARPPVRPRWTAQSGRPARLVVLPFENLGGTEDAYFAAGMTEEIISRLANLQGLVVLSRTTAIGYDRKGKTVRQVGNDLGVDFILEGTIRWEHGAGRESRVRISPQLIRVTDDTNIWAGRYDRVLADIFAIQSEVGENVARAAGLQLVPRERQALETASTRDLEAYDLYLRGLAMANRSQTIQDMDGAIRLFRSATERDPRFTQALLQLAKTHLFVHFLYLDRSPAHVERAKEAVDRLVALGPDLAETHVARAYYTYWGVLDFPRALEAFQAALALQPSNGEALTGYAYVLRRQGRWEEAAQQQTKLLELDPRNPVALLQYGNSCMLLGRYEEADRAWGASTSLSSKFGYPWGRRVWLQVVWRGDADRARAILAEAGRVGGLEDDSDWVAYAAFRLALVGRDYKGALGRLEAGRREAVNNQFAYLPVELLRGQALALSGDREAARTSFAAARRKLEELISKAPDDHRVHASLGIALAGLGLREEALSAARRGTELMPPSADGWKALWRIEDLALVEAMLGLEDRAVERLEFLLARTGEVSGNVLRLDPRWDPLRKNPRFQALLAKHEVKP